MKLIEWIRRLRKKYRMRLMTAAVVRGKGWA
jgi:type II secretory pathway component PulM